MDKLNAMQTFIEVAKHQSFVEASKQLNVSAPAVSRAIAWLESRLKIKLFHRTTRHVRLTESGARYLADVKKILEQIETAETTAAGVHAAPKGLLTVTAPVLFGQKYISPIINEYLALYPEVKIKALFNDRVSGMVEEDLDLAIRIGHLADSNLYATEVGRVRRVICASPGYLKAHGEPQSPVDLKAHQIIFAANFEASGSWHFSHAGKPEHIKLEPRLYCSHNAAAIAAAVAGVGITRVMSYQVAEELEQGSLRRLLPAFEEASLPINVVRVDGRDANRKVQTFLELATARISANPFIN